MRTAVLIAATAAALTLTACNSPDEAATDASTEAAEASGAAVDTAATTTDASGRANAASASGATSGGTSGETMDPATGGTVTDGAMTPGAQPRDTAGNNVTETERRLNPPVPQ